MCDLYVSSFTSPQLYPRLACVWRRSRKPSSNPTYQPSQRTRLEVGVAAFALMSSSEAPRSMGLLITMLIPRTCALAAYLQHTQCTHSVSSRFQ